MSTLETPITAVATSKPAVKAQIQYVIVNFGEAEWGTARVLLLDEDNNAIAAHDVAITVQESEQWQGDDAYILTLALQKLGITHEGAALVQK